MARLLLVGGGRMGGALLAGLIAQRWAAAPELAVVEVDPGRRAELVAAHPGVIVVTDPAQAPDSEAVLLAVKPGDVAGACAAAVRVGARRVLSVAAGVTTATLEEALPAGTPVVRAMPNTPALVGAGAAAISPGTAAGNDDLTWAEEILGAVGDVVRVPEAQLDAVTGLSGSGPAYVFLMAEALAEAGVLVGLPRVTSERLAAQTLLGAARLLIESGESAATLRAQVTSPAGTTAAGLHALEQAGVRAAITDAVVAATARSEALGRL